MAEDRRPLPKLTTMSQHSQSPENSPESVSDIKKVLSGFLAARIELAGLEAKEAVGYAGKKIAYLIVLGISIFFTWCLVLAGLTGFLAPVVDQWLEGKTSALPGWCAVLFLLGLIHAIVALVCILLLKKKPAEALFTLSRQELENDKQWLRKNK